MIGATTHNSVRWGYRPFLMLALSLCLLILPNSSYANRASENITIPVIQDLHFSEALFHFYQQDYFDAAIRIQVAQQQQNLPHHNDEAELLLGGLYLSYNMHQQAKVIFEKLLTREDISQSIRNRAWFQLANSAYQRDYLSDAEDALKNMQGEMSVKLDVQRRYLLGLIFMRQENYDEAVSILSFTYADDEEAGHYAHYNLAISQLSLGNIDAGIKALEALAQMQAGSDEMSVLKDQASMMLGNLYLNDNRLEDALIKLELIPLNSPLSNQALLNTAWSYTLQKKYQQALLFWEELSKRDTIDQSAQDANLMMPYIYAQVGDYLQAIALYDQAAVNTTAEIELLQATKESFRGGSLLEELQRIATTSNNHRLSELIDTLKVTNELRYLDELLVRNDFIAALNNYIELKKTSMNLQQWATSIQAYRDMLETRRQGYQQQLPIAQQRLDALDIAALQKQHDDYQARLQMTINNEDAIALSTPEEHALWQKVVEIEERVSRLPDVEQHDALRHKQRLLKGVLSWQLDNHYIPRIWQAKKALIQLGREIGSTQQKRDSLERSIANTPSTFEGFDQRIEKYNQRVAFLTLQADSLANQQWKYVQSMAIEGLNEKIRSMEDYSARIQFALAQIYDQAGVSQQVE